MTHWDFPTRPIPLETMRELVAASMGIKIPDSSPDRDGATPEVESEDETPAAPIWTGACGTCSRPFRERGCDWPEEITKGE